MFVELLARSCFSFLRGASHPEELVARARELELGGIALCDRDGLYGVARAHTQARGLGQRFIVGAELTVAGRADGKKGVRRGGEDSVLALLVESHEGYRNLCELLTLSHADRPKGESALELSWLAARARGLSAVIPAPRDPRGEGVPSADVLRVVKEAFGERAVLAAYRHLDGFDRARSEWVEQQATRGGFAIVATARPLFHEPMRKPLADVMDCIRQGTTLDKAGTAISGNAEAYLRSERQMKALFRDRIEWVERTEEFALPLGFSLGELRYRFPCQLDPGETADERLRGLTLEGLERRYPFGVPEAVRKQVEKELTLIAKLEVAPYFLSTWEIVEIARRRRILCQGRGSAANSAVCYALGITAVDPARSNLLFERFMSEERREPPDIDIDFEHERREEVIQEIYERYGRDRAAMVSEVICYRGKSALREVGKVFGFSLEQADRLSGAMLHFDAGELDEQRLGQMGFDTADGRVQKVVTLARMLQGFPRHLSIHVGGFVLSAAPLCEVAPVEPARMQDRTVVPWDKDDLEELGFFKVDILGLGMLTAIRKALELIHAGGGLRLRDRNLEDSNRAEESFDPLEVITRVPAEDPVVYEMISHADTVGVFQIESRAQMAMLPRLRPQCFYDLVVEVAIVRPGPIQGGMVHPYLRRRNGEERITVPHRDLWPILERTLGVPLFQEQVMQIAIVGAGYSGGEADQLRRDMAAWKKTGRLLRHRERLLSGFAKRGIKTAFGEALFEQIKGFGEYGFPESHAASFALLVYASAWLKARYPAHFACALLNAQPMGFYSPSSIIKDAQRHGVEVRDVCVVQSLWDSQLEAGSPEIPSDEPGAHRALRLGFRLVKGFGHKPAERIEAARSEEPFRDIEDLACRAKLKKNEVEALAEAGALERLVRGRRQALWAARTPRLEGLFDGERLEEPEVRLPALRAEEQLLLDYERKGLSVSDHPLRHLRVELKRRGVTTAAQLAALPKGRRVSVAGLVICRQQPATASGTVFITLEDETGFCNLIVWRATFERYRLEARHSTVLLAFGEIEREVKERKLSSPRETEEEGPVVRAPALKPAKVPVVHLIVHRLERLDVPGRRLRASSRDFH
jgi:error-prone DNA polymerase